MSPQPAARLAAAPAGSALSIRNLSVVLHRGQHGHRVVQDLDLDLDRGRILALVGESGSGKSTIGLAALGLLPADSRPQVGGSLKVAGQEIVGAPDHLIRRIRRDQIGCIFQDPMTSLDPTMRIGRQLIGRLGSEARAVEWLDRVGIPNARSRMNVFPHQLSGGQRQRVMIALAMGSRPALVIADEPTTALDVTVQAQILALLRHLSQEEGTAFLFITHDLAVAASLADGIAVLYGGRLVETGTTRGVIAAPGHPYTAALLEARFDFGAPKDRQLPAIAAGAVATEGCAFAPRCMLAEARCRSVVPALRPVAQHDGAAACLRSACVTARLWRRQARPWPESSAAGPIVVEMFGIEKSYAVRRRGCFGGKETIHALRGVNLRIRRGEAVSIVGESGSGKSTLGRIVAGLIRPDRGSFRYDGREPPQMVFQDAVASLTPWLTISELVSERVRDRPRFERRALTARALERVGLPASIAAVRPAQLSVGQSQRVAIARTIVRPPDLLVCDEAVSAMDVSLAAGILNLLGTLRRELEMALLFITHDLAAARFVGDRILVMQNGLIVEEGDADAVLRRPTDPYTQRLIASLPVPP